MPVQIDEVQAELVTQPKPEGAASRQAPKSEPDLRRIFERMQQRAKRLRTD